jgi:hypothetical protein
MTDAKLDQLIQSNSIKSYVYENIDENGNPGQGRFRNTERLTITLNDDSTITIDTACSGVLENTILCIS